VTVRIIQVGLGEWGRDWAANVLPVAEGIDVVAFVDNDPTALAIAVRSGLVEEADAYESLGAALGAVEADAVLITAAIASHGELIMESLAAGRHVLVEKPFVPTLEEARRAVDFGAERGLVLAVVQNFRYYAPVLLASELIRDSAFGPVRGVAVDFRRFHPYDDAASRAPELDHSILVQIAIHHFDLMRAVLGQDAATVYCRTWNPSESASVAPAAASAVIELQDGTIATYRANMVATAEETPWCGAWRIECADADLVWAGPHYPIVGGKWRYDLREPGFLEIQRRGEKPRRRALTAMLGDRLLVLEAFVDAIQTGAELPISGRNNLGSVAMMEAALLSARTGERVKVDHTYRRDEPTRAI
jgi:predicted dehydrogenase